MFKKQKLEKPKESFPRQNVGLDCFPRSRVRVLRETTWLPPAKQSRRVPSEETNMHALDPEIVREEPKKAQKLSGRSPKSLRNCPGGASKGSGGPSKTVREESKNQKLSGRSPKNSETGRTQKGSETVREPKQARNRRSPKKAQKLSGRSPKKLRNCPGGACRNCPGGARLGFSQIPGNASPPRTVDFSTEKSHF